MTDDDSVQAGPDEQRPATDDETALTDLQFVGEHTAAVCRSAGIRVVDLQNRQISYEQLLEAGVNPGVAAKLRRRYSLSWSFTTSGDVVRRSKHVNGLDEREADWIAQSSGDWLSAIEERRSKIDQAGADRDGTDRDLADPDGTDRATPNGGQSSAADGGSAVHFGDSAGESRPSRPDPPTPLSSLELSPAAIDRLEDAGIASVRRLATIEPDPVAEALGVDRSRIADWRELAADYQSRRDAGSD